MFRSTTVLALAATIFIPAFTGTASACNSRGYRHVSYYSQPTTTRIVRTVHVSHLPTIVTQPVSVSTVALVTKKAKIVIKPDLSELIVGSTVTASANFLGSEQGFVFMQLGSATLQCDIIDWTASSVTFKMPNLGLRMPTNATLELVRPDGRIVRDFKVALTPKAGLVQHSGSDTLAIPASNGSAKPRVAIASGLLLEAPAAPVSEASIVITQ